MDSSWKMSNNPIAMEYINKELNLRFDNDTEPIEIDDSDATFFEPDSDNDFNMDLPLCELNLNCNYSREKVNEDVKKNSDNAVEISNYDFEKMDTASCSIISNTNLRKETSIFGTDSAIDVKSSSSIIAVLDEENELNDSEINKPSTSQGLYRGDKNFNKIMTPIVIDSDDSADENEKGTTNLCLETIGNSYDIENDLLAVQEYDVDISCAEKCLSSEKFQNKVNGIWNQCELNILNGKKRKLGKKYLMKVKNDLTWLNYVVKLYNNWMNGKTSLLDRKDVEKTVTRLEDTKNLLKASFANWKAKKSHDEFGWNYPSIIAEHNSIIWMMDKLKKGFLAQMKICDRKYHEEIEKLKDSISSTGSSTSTQTVETIYVEEEKEERAKLLSALRTGPQECHDKFNQPFNDLHIPSTSKNIESNRILHNQPLECKPDLKSTRSECYSQLPSILKHQLKIQQDINQSLVSADTNKLIQSTETVGSSLNLINSNDKRPFSNLLVSSCVSPTKKVRFSDDFTNTVQTTELHPIVNQIETINNESENNINSRIIQQNETNSTDDSDEDEPDFDFSLFVVDNNLRTNGTDHLNNAVSEIDQRFQNIQVTNYQNPISNIVLGSGGVPLLPVPFDLSHVRVMIRLPYNDVSEIEYRSMTTYEIFCEMLNLSDSDSVSESSDDDDDDDDLITGNINSGQNF